MKKILAFILVFLMIFTCTVPVIFAESSTNTDSSETISSETDHTITETEKKESEFERLEDGAVTFSSNYSTDGKKIEIHGSVDHEIIADYSKYTIEIIQILPTQSTKDAIQAKKPKTVAKTDISMSFALSFEAKKAIDRFSGYAVVLRSPEDELILAAEPQYVCVKSSYVADRSQFKGIFSPDNVMTSIGGDLGFGTAIIPVYYDKLVNNDGNGYMYAHEDRHIYFDKAYIDELDGRIRTYSASGTRVYIQLLMPSGEISIETFYQMPDVYNADIISQIRTNIEFLTTRYDNYSSGRISGFIVGKQIDKYSYNYSKEKTIEEYANKYALYLTVVANTARFKNSNIDIVVPFSNFNSYSNAEDLPTDGYSPSLLQQKICEALDERFASAFQYSSMIETDVHPVVSSLDDENKLTYTANTQHENEIGIYNVGEYTRFLSSLDKQYNNIPSNTIYLWDIPTDLYGNLLSASYVYSYYGLFYKSRISAFVISFRGASNSAIFDIEQYVRYINTDKGADKNKELLKWFKIEQWSSLIKDFSGKNLEHKKLYTSGNDYSASSGWTGSFSYYDFSLGNTKDFLSASFGRNLKYDYDENGRRALKQTVGRVNGLAHSDIICLYEYNETFEYTPVIKFELGVTDNNIEGGELYEIIVTVGTKDASVSKSYIVRAGEPTEIWLDVEEYSKENKVSYIKIGSRSITGTAFEYSLWLYEISGFSSSRTTDDLDMMINVYRNNIRNKSDVANSNASNNVVYWVIFFIIILAITSGGVMFVLLRRDDTVNKKREKETDKSQ